MSLRGELLLAVTGVFPDEITPAEHAAATTVLATWERRLKAWTGREEATPWAYKEPANLDRLFAKLAEDPDKPTVEMWFNGLGVDDGDLCADYYIGLIRARQYLVDAWPKFAIEGPTGPKVLPLSHDDAAEMWSLIRVVDDCEIVLDEMDMWSLTASQSAAFRACFPDLFAEAQKLLRDQLANRLAKDPAFDVGWEREAVINVFEGKPPEGELKSPPPAPEPESKVKLDPDREKTQAQVSGSAKGQK